MQIPPCLTDLHLNSTNLKEFLSQRLILGFVLLSLVLYKNLSGVSYSAPRHCRGLSSLRCTLVIAEKPVFSSYIVSHGLHLFCATHETLGIFYWDWWECYGPGPASLDTLQVLPWTRVLPRNSGRTVLLADLAASVSTIVWDISVLSQWGRSSSLLTSPFFVRPVF